jgi:hypothetical protein
MSQSPQTPITQANLKDFFRALEEAKEPIDPSNPRYVDHLYGEQGPMQELQRYIELSQQNTMSYFTGLRGTGKSTQLRYLREQLQGEFAIALLDMSEYIPDNEPLDSVGFLISLAAALGDHLDSVAANNPLIASPLSRLWTYLKNTDISITEVNAEVGAPGKGKVSFKASLHTHPSFRQRARDAFPDTKARLITEGRAVIAQMAEALKQSQAKAQTLILVDSLERLHDPSTSNEGKVTESVRQLFDNDRAALAISGAHIVYSVPPYLTANANLAGQVKVARIGSVRVYEYPNLTGDAAMRRQPRQAGITKMREVLTGIYPDWRKVMSDEAFQLLTLQSGGDLRQFLFRFVTDLILKVYSDVSRLPLQSSDQLLLDLVKQAQVQCEELVVGDELPLLAQIAKNVKAHVNSMGERLTLARFYDNRCLLNYNNGTEWVEANPLLWDLIAKYESSVQSTQP